MAQPDLGHHLQGAFRSSCNERVGNGPRDGTSFCSIW
jgi:hypothetical protein